MKKYPLHYPIIIYPLFLFLVTFFGWGTVFDLYVNHLSSLTIKIIDVILPFVIILPNVFMLLYNRYLYLSKATPMKILFCNVFMFAVSGILFLVVSFMLGRDLFDDIHNITNVVLLTFTIYSMIVVVPMLISAFVPHIYHRVTNKLKSINKYSLALEIVIIQALVFLCCFIILIISNATLLLGSMMFLIEPIVFCIPPILLFVYGVVTLKDSQRPIRYGLLFGCLFSVSAVAFVMLYSFASYPIITYATVNNQETALNWFFSEHRQQIVYGILGEIALVWSGTVVAVAIATVKNIIKKHKD
ncbi:MAG: hypothetical protein E7653_01490 [Ruminococcaceae bacterium]|nr:hypothetical protein [Oscillospiraceae bacterium]